MKDTLVIVSLPESRYVAQRKPKLKARCQSMDWTIVIIAVVAITSLFLIKRMSFVSVEDARRHLANGALVIDVRSVEEFQRDHLSVAVNIPLGELQENLPRSVKEKNQPVLVHCLSGGRSAIAKRQIKLMGYPNVFNLGSLARAKQIVNG